MTSTVKHNSPGDHVLNTEKISVKFNKDIIVTDKAINREKILTNMWDVKDIIQF
jgi:hypothetical protein